MYHPVLLQREVLQDLPALLEDLRPRVAETAAAFSYRSEAFAEDLPGVASAEPDPGPKRRGFAGFLFAAPLGMALVGAVLAFLGTAD